MRWSRNTTYWFFGAWLAAALYAIPFIDRGWLPHDEGLMGQMAERVLSGELPHRDFDEVYTGGLDYVHALAFKLWGIRSIALRRALFAFYLVWVPVVFWIASRMGPAPIAALVTAVSVAWSVPNYFASMPSWYTLFFTTFGIAALMRYLETRRCIWLFTAGVVGGLSFLIKSTAVYFILAAVLFLCTREVIESFRAGSESKDQSVSALKMLVAALVTAAVAVLIRTQATVVGFVHFLAPVAMVSFLLIDAERFGGRRAAPGRLPRLVALLAPFAAGVAIPVAGFLIPYVLSGAAEDLWRGVFVTPQRRLQSVRYDLPVSWSTLVPACGYAVVLFRSTSMKWEQFRAEYFVAFIASLCAMFALSAGMIGYQALWNLARHLNIVAVAAGVLVVHRSMRSTWPPSVAAQSTLLLVLVMAFMALTEFPFANPIYFCYTAPLVALSLLAVVRTEPPTLQRRHAVVAVVVLLFAVVRLNREYVHQVGFGPAPRYVVGPWDVPRSGLRVGAPDREVYTPVLKLIAAHARGRYLYAAPDCPEVYFLSGLRNPTRTFYEVFDEKPMTAEAVLDLIDRHAITVVVIDTVPEFSRPLAPETVDALAMRFPQSAASGKFVVRWAE